MSYTELKIVKSDGDVVHGPEFKNAHGWCSMVWDALVEKHEVSRIFKEKTGANLAFSMMLWDKLWQYHRDGDIKLSAWESNVLDATYDRVIILREYLPTLVKSLDKFYETYSTATRVCHLNAIARAIEAQLEDPDVKGIGFYGMSVGEDLLGERSDLSYPEPEEGESDEAFEARHEAYEESHRSYNINKDTDHWFADLLPVASA